MQNYTYNSNYQDRIDKTISNALQTHPRITCIRVDLRLPDNFLTLAVSSSLPTRFIESLKAKITVDLKNKERAWIRKLSCVLKYVWVREFGQKNGKKHFHVLLLLNKDVYYSLGDFNVASGNLASMIREAWCSALQLPYPAYQRLVHFPLNAVMHMDVNRSDFEQQLERVIDRASYLAKEATKHYGDGERSFGCSR